MGKKPRIDLDKKDFKRLQAKIEMLKSLDKTVLDTEIGRAAMKMARDIKEDAPFDTGNLKLNIKAVLSNKKAEIRSDAPYSGFVEFGGGKPRKVGEIPFFYPNINKGIREMIKSIDNKIKNLLR